ncbi:LacI family DNA-binding transcriptional regulator [Coraliomargarita algicola]|uniref:LacI family DNA-binding transcriptional regulator n=1 Tax=Coraliomargarita algicola TaxID=3092156 RepID=A0ABZ0RI24_9BACT|nr:LacI family DNA-binding transcriptional regulator [Coraliomargarita sp. J2-16]WPJ95850.1 LacI family DNA-binding transcriptional regulator [Coraliomargarita sp. J2-16]
MPKKKTAKSSSSRPTILELAKLTNLSQGAVSRAINGQGGISDTTRERILKAAREIGYQPNPSARNFKRGYTKRIGMILPNLANANYSELYEHLDLSAAAEGYSSILALAHQSAERERKLLLEFSAGEADGLVVNPVKGLVNLDIYRKLKAWKYPLLFLYVGHEDEFDSLGVDYSFSLRKAMEYLRDVGHTHVAYVGPSAANAIPVGKHDQLIAALQKVGLQYDAELSVFEVDASEAGEASFAQWRAMGKQPTAVVAYNDQTAISLSIECKRQGLSVPKDLSILGSDDITSAEALELSTLRVDREVMAQTGFRMLQNRIKNFDSPIQLKKLRSEFLLRSSMGPARK